MTSYEEERSSQDPEDNSSSPGQEEERDGAESDESVLLSEADLVTCNTRIIFTVAKRRRERLPAMESFLSLFLMPAM